MSGDSAAGAGNAGESGSSALAAGAGPSSIAGAAGSLGAESGAAGQVTAVCADDAAPNAWASWPLSDPTTEGEPHSQAFTVEADVATDAVTELVWQRHSPVETFTWSEARQYCGCLSLAGYDDWQLPSRIELVSIVDYTKQSPSIDELAFPDTPFEWFWSASALAGDERYWYVAFFDGDTHAASPDQEYRVRCVRHAVGQLPRYDVSLAGTVKDASTGLTWQRDTSVERLTWSDAKLACDALGLAGGGWRLPSMSELQSLIDETQADPAIDAAAFPATPSEGFWAATPLAGTTTAAWFVSFLEGIAYNALLERPYRFRCVR